MPDSDWMELLDRRSKPVDPRWKRCGDLAEMGVLSGIGWANWLGEHGVTPRVVPSEFWALDVRDTGATRIDRISGKDEAVVERVVVIACPCGQQPLAVERVAPMPCGCERSFFFDGENVYAFNTPSVAA